MAKTEKSTKMITLSARMQALANMVTEGNRICDLGCDHGWLSIYLVQHKISPCALAMDVRKGPLMQAAAHVREAGLDKYITLRLSDGLAGYSKGEADTLICAGMGGPLMRRILAADLAKADSFRELILQPQSEIASFRSFLRESGWRVLREDMILEEGKFYPMMKAVPAEDASVRETEPEDGQEKPEEKEPVPPGILQKPEREPIPPELSDRFGPILLLERHPVLWEYLKREWKKHGELKAALLAAPGSRRAGERLSELSVEITYLKEAAKLYGKDYD